MAVNCGRDWSSELACYASDDDFPTSCQNVEFSTHRPNAFIKHASSASQEDGHANSANLGKIGQHYGSDSPLCAERLRKQSLQLGSLRRDRRNRRQIPNSGIQATS